MATNSINSLIVKGAMDIIKRVPIYRPYKGEPGYCLANVRVAVEGGLGLPGHGFFDRYLSHRVEPAGYPLRTAGPWSRSMQRSLRSAGLAVERSKVRAGDLVFWWKTAYDRKWDAYVGHTGVIVKLHGDLYVAENIDPKYRDWQSLKSASHALTPLAWFEARAEIIGEPEFFSLSLDKDLPDFINPEK